MENLESVIGFTSLCLDEIPSTDIPQNNKGNDHDGNGKNQKLTEEELQEKTRRIFIERMMRKSKGGPFKRIF